MTSVRGLCSKQQELADENRHFQPHILTQGNGIIIFKLERLKVLLFKKWS